MQMCRIEKLKCVGSFVKITHYTNTLHRHYTSHWLHCIPTRSTALSDGDNVSGRLTSKLWNVCQHLAGIWRQKQIFSHWAPPAPAGWEEAVHNRLILIDISNHCPLHLPHTPLHHLPCVSDSPAQLRENHLSGQLIPSLNWLETLWGGKLGPPWLREKLKSSINLTARPSPHPARRQDDLWSGNCKSAKNIKQKLFTIWWKYSVKQAKYFL